MNPSYSTIVGFVVVLQTAEQAWNARMPHASTRQQKQSEWLQNCTVTESS